MPFNFVLDRIKHSLLTLACGALFLYFVLPGVIGDRGVLAMHRMRDQLAVSKAELAQVQKDRTALEMRTQLLRPDHLDLDMLDERARATLGSTGPNEYVIYYDQDR
ncbi:MAG: septum formation initiator family protein [Proteobacteria bacterium]|nr:septum formation initiator family protein [Pseudomonadota bacterium]